MCKFIGLCLGIVKNSKLTVTSTQTFNLKTEIFFLQLSFLNETYADVYKRIKKKEEKKQSPYNCERVHFVLFFVIASDSLAFLLVTPSSRRDENFRVCSGCRSKELLSGFARGKERLPLRTLRSTRKGGLECGELRWVGVDVSLLKIFLLLLLLLLLFSSSSSTGFLFFLNLPPRRRQRRGRPQRRPRAQHSHNGHKFWAMSDSLHPPSHRISSLRALRQSSFLLPYGCGFRLASWKTWFSHFSVLSLNITKVLIDCLAKYWNQTCRAGIMYNRVLFVLQWCFSQWTASDDKRIRRSNDPDR